MRKLIWYRETLRYAQKRESGDTVALLDADMLMTSPLPDLDFGDADILFTKRSAGLGVVNTGVIFVDPTRSSLDFFDRWIAALDWLYKPAQFERYVEIAQKHAGGDQAALALLREDPLQYPAVLGEIPCEWFNLTQSEWELYSPGRSVFVHIKSDLRKLCFGERERMLAPETPMMRELASIWQSYDRGGNSEATEA
jgi:hypothetical protein